MRDTHYESRIAVIFSAAVIALLGGCHGEAGVIPTRMDLPEEMTYTLRVAPAERAVECLTALGIRAAAGKPEGQAVAVIGSNAQLEKASVVLELIDADDEFVVETLAHTAKARILPSNEQIARALGGISIGTFSEPPPSDAVLRGIIDIHESAVIAIVPGRFRQALLAAISGDAKAAREIQSVSRESVSLEPLREKPGSTLPIETRSAMEEPPHALETTGQEPSAYAPAQKPRIDVEAAPADSKGKGYYSEEAATKLALKPPLGEVIAFGADSPMEVNEVRTCYQLPTLPNGDMTLELDLPQTMDLPELLDLAAEYLDLDYMYEPTRIQGQTVTLKLHGKLQGRIQVKELYPLVESVLKFKGFAMTRHEGRMVTVFPLDEALGADPRLLLPDTGNLEVGDMVVTRVFELRHVDAWSAMSLLESMKLSIAVSPIEETRSLIVTGYAHRINRIEQLLSMIDRPGTPRVFRSRQLRYTMADMLVGRLRLLAEQFQVLPVTVAPLRTAQSALAQIGRDVQPAAQPQSTSRIAGSGQSRQEADGADDRMSVYLDADERTNRILMLGYEEQVSLVEKLIEAVDLPGHDIRILRVYYLNHVNAGEAKVKLEDLAISDRTEATAVREPGPSGQGGAAAANAVWSVTVEGDLVGQPQVAVLEGTNALLVNATEEQHLQVKGILEYVDETPKDLRVVRVYDVNHVDAEDAKKKLRELGVVAGENGPGFAEGRPAEKAPSGAEQARAVQFLATEDPQSPSDQAQVVVREGTNSLVVYAMEQQHARIAETIRHLDAETLEQAIPYEIYFLENQEPGHLAEVLQNIIQETLKDEQGKIEQVIRRTEDRIVVVPDEGTFSVIVYASKKNQEWISKLITSLDKRRPQVLIDVTLVEITETDAFNYDLDIIRGWPHLADSSAVSGVEPNDNMIGTFARSAGGSLTAFYGDRQVQALLTAVQSKNYGRVLAKPKVLVNDNEDGLIKTTDTTYVETKSGIPVSSGTVGNQQNFVETSVKYESYEAGITLDIKPHISEGDLLRLDISLVRSDFLPTESPVKPPNTTASEVKTAVTVPDGSTIILGGLLKLNQNKGGRKVPLLGDIPIIGGLFRSASTLDKQSKLYVFVKAEIIRLAENGGRRSGNLRQISERDRRTFEEHENEFQSYQVWPGIEPEPMAPAKVLDAR